MDNFAPALATGDSQTGLTNQWLTSRNNMSMFQHKFPDYTLFMDGNDHPTTLYRDVAKTAVERTPLSDAFFSADNIAVIKSLLVERVYQRSGGLYTITPEAQSTEALMNVMSSVYMDNARNLPDNIPQQVAEINALVLKDIVPRVISNIKMSLTYRRDASNQPLTMDRPMWTSSAGKRSNQTMANTFI